MRFNVGLPPTNPDFSPGQPGWTQLNLPNPYLLTLIGIPIGGLTAFVLILGWEKLFPLDAEFGFRIPGVGHWVIFAIPFLLIAGLLLVVFVHELLHCLGHPKCGLSSQSCIGVWPTKLLFYATYLGGIGRNRYLLLGMLPFLVLSVLPLVVCAAIGEVGVTTLTLLSAVSVFNGFSSCGDFLIFPIIVFQVPSGAVIHDHGWDMYWKVIEKKE